MSTEMYEKAICFKLPREQHAALKSLSESEKISINQLIRNAIKLILNKYKKGID